MQVNVTPLVVKAGNLEKIDESNDEIKIFNPRDLIERSLSF